MWARVKSATENAVLALALPLDAYADRPGAVQPMHGITSKTRLHRVLYVVTVPLMPLLRRLSPGLVTTTEELGKVMPKLPTSGAPARTQGHHRDRPRLMERSPDRARPLSRTSYL